MRCNHLWSWLRRDRQWLCLLRICVQLLFEFFCHQSARRAYGAPVDPCTVKIVWIPNPDRHFPHTIPMVDRDLGLAVLQHDAASSWCPRNSVAHLGDLANAQQRLCWVNHCEVAFQDLAVLKSHGNRLCPKVWQNPSICHGKLLISSWWCHWDTRQNTKWQSGITCTWIHNQVHTRPLLASGAIPAWREWLWSWAIKPCQLSHSMGLLFFCGLCLKLSFFNLKQLLVSWASPASSWRGESPLPEANESGPIRPRFRSRFFSLRSPKAILGRLEDSSSSFSSSSESWDSSLGWT